MLDFLFWIVYINTMEKEQFIKDVIPYRSKLKSYAQRLLKEEDAEDIIQEVFLKLWCMRNALDEYNNIYALAVQITKYSCINHIRASKKQNIAITDSVILESNTTAPDTHLVNKDDMEHIMRIIDQLPGLQQAILRMKHIDGLEIEEIAELTGCKPGAIHMNLSRARKRVKELFFKMQGL